MHSENPFDEVRLPTSDDVFAEPNLTEEMRIGESARALIESEPYKLVTRAMQDAIWQAFTATPLRDRDGLLYLRLMQKAVTDMHQLLNDASETGKLAAAQLTQAQQSATSQMSN